MVARHRQSHGNILQIMPWVPASGKTRLTRTNKATTLPVGPWMDVGVDLLGPLPSGNSILVVVDNYSRYYEYSILQSTTTEKVLDSLDDIFSRQGWPMTIKPDHGPQFRSDEFGEYCTHYAIRHLRVTPKVAHANGEVERQNASIMKRVRIVQAAGLNWKKELRTYVAKFQLSTA